MFRRYRCKFDELKYCTFTICIITYQAYEWGQFFSNLYSDTHRDHYDVEFQAHVEERVRTITSDLPISCRGGDTAKISVDEIVSAVKCLKPKKHAGQIEFIMNI